MCGALGLYFLSCLVLKQGTTFGHIDGGDFPALLILILDKSLEVWGGGSPSILTSTLQPT